MRLGNRGEAIQLTPQSGQALRWSCHGLVGQCLDPEQDRGYRGVVTDQVPNSGRKVGSRIDQCCEHAPVLAPVMHGQGRAEHQAVGLQTGRHVLTAAELLPDPGELAPEVLMSFAQLPAERHGSLMVAGGHVVAVPFASRLHA
jgi:hypothetical protein